MQGRCLVWIGLLAFGFSTEATGQVIQLPTFVYFLPNTSVLVPDGGSAHLGSVGRAAYGRVSRGMPGVSKIPGIGRLFRNQGISSHVGSASSSVHVTVMDFDAMDRAVLAAAPKRHTENKLDPRALAIEQQISQGPNQTNRSRVTTGRGKPLASVAEIRRHNAIRRQAEHEEATRWFSKGQQAEKDSKPGVARIFYHMAARQADAALQKKILVRLNALPARKHP